MRRIRRVTVRNFRSYTSIDLSLDGRSVALTGANGAGKTNLLEALSLVGPGRGLRRATFADVQAEGSREPWGIGLGLDDEDGDLLTLSVRSDGAPAPRREVRVGSKVARSPSMLMDYIRFAWLTPAQDRLFVDGASERRRFLDRMTMAYDPAHGQAASQYEGAMRQRQAALEQGQRDVRVLSILERQMAESGVAVAAARREMVARLSVGYEKIRSGAFPSADLALDGELESALQARDAASVEDDFAEKLERVRGRDREAGRAIEGPHRSDLLVVHREKAQPAKRCSTGEQKAMLIGLVLSHAAAHAELNDASLVLLLDEVAAHLDRSRREALAEILDGLGHQVFMTGTDEELFSAWGDRALHFAVADGQATLRE